MDHQHNTVIPPFQQQSYQHPSPDNAVGPGLSKIIQEMERQRRDLLEGEQMRRRTRILYVLLGVVLLCIYFSLAKRHFFRIGKVKVPPAQEEDIRGGTNLRQVVDDVGSVQMHASLGKPHCYDGGYSKRTLKKAYELPFAAMFQDTRGQNHFDASGITLVEGTVYAVYDSSWAISKFGNDLRPFSPLNKQIIGAQDRDTEVGGYRALIHDNGIFYALRRDPLIIDELDMGEDRYQIRDACPIVSELDLQVYSKGLESMLVLRDRSNEIFLLGLCNQCDRGFVAMKKIVADDGSCQWKTVRTLEIPHSANKRDYSSATMGQRGRVALSSPRESTIWVGQLLGYDETTGTWDLENLKFDPDNKGKVLAFPKNDNCETVYCNIQGIHWINQETIMAVSDKMKSFNGKEDFRCFEKDQSAHVFVLPS